MASELAKGLGFAEEAAVPDATEHTSLDVVSVDHSASESRGFGVEEVVEEKDGLLGQFGTSCSGEFDVKEEPETMSRGLGGQLGLDQVPLSGIGGDLDAKEDISEGEEDAEMSTVAADADMNTAVSLKSEVVGEGGKEESNEEELELESSEDEEDDEKSSETSSSSEEGEEQRAKKDEESSEASSSSDEEEQRAKNYGGGVHMEALLEEGELMIGSDADDYEEAPKGRIKSKHEAEVLPPVPKIEIELEPHHKTLPIMGERVIVEGSVQHNPLNEGSILWITESRTPLGIVDELFGPVKNPYYLVRYNSAEEVPAGISAGTAVSFVMEFADHILNMKELYSKGYDASGDNDEDQANEPEFSDDEEEAEYKRSLRLAKRQTDRQHECKKLSGDRKRAQPRGTGFRKDMPPRIRDTSTPGYQSKPHFHRSEMSHVVGDNATLLFGPQNFPMSAPTMLPAVPMNPAMPSAVQLTNQMRSYFINPSQQSLLQLPNVVWPGGLPPPPHPNKGVEGAAMAANIMQNILIGANQYQQQFQNQNFGGFPNQMPMPPPRFLPQSGMPANPMLPGVPPVNPTFGPAPPGFPNAQGFGHLPTPHGYGEEPHMQFNSGQFNRNPSFRGRKLQQRGGQHSSGRGGGRYSPGTANSVPTLGKASRY